jgi:hypothetical protein
MPLSRNAKTLADALAEMPAAAELLARLHASQSVARTLAAAAPPIGAGFDPLRPGACELRGGHLLLTVTSPAQAAKLRQEFPRLQKLLKQQGLDLTEIRLRLQPAHKSYREEVSSEAQVSRRADEPADSARGCAERSAALRFADELALTLPDSPLRAAAERLREMLRRQVTKSR